MEYNQKIIYWKHKCQIHLYKSPIKVETEKSVSPVKAFPKKRTKYEDMDLRDKIASNIRRQNYYKKQVYYLTDLAIQNNLDTFITLTFSQNIKGYDKAQHEWDLFLKRLKYSIDKDLKYIAVHELQKKNRNVYHFHALLNLGFFPVEKLEKIWKNGFVYIERINTANPETKLKQIMYNLKYITKDIYTESMTGVRNTARKVYRSRNLEKPVVQKEFTTELSEDIIFKNMEDVIETTSYPIYNYKGNKINEVDSIKIRKEHF